jgi:hypothetical protein
VLAYHHAGIHSLKLFMKLYVASCCTPELRHMPAMHPTHPRAHSTATRPLYLGPHLI